MSEEIRPDCGNKLDTRKLFIDVMNALNHSEEVAYKVYLKLAIKYGAGQKLVS